MLQRGVEDEPRRDQEKDGMDVEREGRRARRVDRLPSFVAEVNFVRPSFLLSSNDQHPRSLFKMALYPALNVISTPTTLYLTTGPHIHSFNAVDSSFSPLASTSSLLDSDVHKGLIRLVAVSKDGKWLASVADDKLLKVWEVKEGGKEIKLDSSR